MNYNDDMEFSAEDLDNIMATSSNRLGEAVASNNPDMFRQSKADELRQKKEELEELRDQLNLDGNRQSRGR